MNGVFTTGGRTHTILARLAQSRCMAGYLFRALSYPREVPDNVRRKFWHLIDHLKREGLVVMGPDKFLEITPEGLDLLEALNRQGRPSMGPNVRIFTREAA